MTPHLLHLLVSWSTAKHAGHAHLAESFARLIRHEIQCTAKP